MKFPRQDRGGMEGTYREASKQVPFARTSSEMLLVAPTPIVFVAVTV
jgi:hypothetical protein